MQWLLLLQSTGSRACGFQSLQHMGPVVVVYRQVRGKLEPFPGSRRWAKEMMALGSICLVAKEGVQQRLERGILMALSVREFICKLAFHHCSLPKPTNVSLDHFLQTS